MRRQPRQSARRVLDNGSLAFSVQEMWLREAEIISTMPRRISSIIALIMSCTGTALADDMKVGSTGAAYGLLLRLSEAFHAVSPGDRIEVVSGLGSGGAIAAAAEGAIGLAIVSRDLKPEETAKGLVVEPLPACAPELKGGRAAVVGPQRGGAGQPRRSGDRCAADRTGLPTRLVRKRARPQSDR